MLRTNDGGLIIAWKTGHPRAFWFRKGLVEVERWTLGSQELRVRRSSYVLWLGRRDFVAYVLYLFAYQAEHWGGFGLLE